MTQPTGQGSTLVAQKTSLKFGSTEAYKIHRITPVFERSINTHDASHLGQPSGDAALTCPGDLVTIGPVTVEVAQDFENTSRFENETDGTEGIKQPLPLGEETGTVTTDMFLLTLKGGTETSQFANVLFSGFATRMSGMTLERNRQNLVTETIVIQPDGSSIVWDAAGS